MRPLLLQITFGKLKRHETGRPCTIRGPGNELETCVLQQRGLLSDWLIGFLVFSLLTGDNKDKQRWLLLVVVQSFVRKSILILGGF